MGHRRSQRRCSCASKPLGITSPRGLWTREHGNRVLSCSDITAPEYALDELRFLAPAGVEAESLPGRFELLALQDVHHVPEVEGLRTIASMCASVDRRSATESWDRVVSSPSRSRESCSRITRRSFGDRRTSDMRPQHISCEHPAATYWRLAEHIMAFSGDESRPRRSAAGFPNNPRRARQRRSAIRYVLAITRMPSRKAGSSPDEASSDTRGMDCTHRG